MTGARKLGAKLRMVLQKRSKLKQKRPKLGARLRMVSNGMLAAGLNTALLFSILSSMAKKHTDYDDFFR